MFISGIADEAGPKIEAQIRAHAELGWKHIELRTIEDKCITDLDDATFDNVAQQLSDAGITVSCFASQLANWARPIDTDFEVDLAELRRAIPRMQQMGTRFIRCMSYPNCDPPLSDADWRNAVIERMSRLAEIAAEDDVVLVHENCHGWASQNADTTIELLNEVGSEHLKLVFDTGNPISSGVNVWKLYQALREHTVYIHIKDYRWTESADGERTTQACFPGEGEGCVEQIVKDLLQSGYDGGFSIEPHITSVIHLAQTASDPEEAYKTYVEYGRRFGSLLESAKP